MRFETKLLQLCLGFIDSPTCLCTSFSDWWGFLLDVYWRVSLLFSGLQQPFEKSSSNHGLDLWYGFAKVFGFRLQHIERLWNSVQEGSADEILLRIRLLILVESLEGAPVCFVNCYLRGSWLHVLFVRGYYGEGYYVVASTEVIPDLRGEVG